MLAKPPPRPKAAFLSMAEFDAFKQAQRARLFAMEPEAAQRLASSFGDVKAGGVKLLKRRPYR